tara:strand:- start:23096 stop:24376 length:1281 start_codon:yes stop_codon:yes gene_type:complete
VTFLNHKCVYVFIVASLFSFELLAGPELDISRDNGPIVKVSNPATVTHKMKIGKTTIGVSDLGGGYVNYFHIPGLGNVAVSDYGKGWQGSIRDRYHEGRYNPTQAGFRDTAGAPARVNLYSHRISIPPFQMALYGDPVYDFTEYENLAPDYSGYNDGNRRDKDGINESGYDQDDELRSEWDFQGFYDNVSDKTKSHGVETVKFTNRNTYARNPKAILQFGSKAVRENGVKVLQPKYAVNDVSPLLPGAQTTSPVDLANVIFTAYGIRLPINKGFKYGHYHDGNQWRRLSLAQMRTGKNLQINTGGMESRVSSWSYLSTPLLILSNNVDPAKGHAIGLYSPNDARNRNQSIGRRVSDGRVMYSEDRRTRSWMLFSANNDQVSIRTRYILTGIMAPNRAKANHVEGIRHNSYILYGTPKNILKAIKEL